MNEIKVSVVIPVYNVEKYLEECLDSVINQSLKDIEVICIDDGSTDYSSNILNNYLIKDNRIKIISKEHEGVGFARKSGFELTSGEFIFFMDSDDFLEFNALEKLYENAISNNSDVVFYKIIMYNHLTNKQSYLNPGFDFDLIFNEDFNNFTFDYNDVKHYVLNASFTAGSKLYKKSFLDKYNDWFFLKNNYYCDIPLHVQIMLRAKMSFCPEFLYNCRESNETFRFNSFDNNHIFDIFKVVDIVEFFLKENNFWSEFNIDFNKFKFEQIVQNIITFASEQYFHQAKLQLMDLEINFEMDFVNQIIYETILNSNNYYEFYNCLFISFKDKLFWFNNEFNKNSVITEKDNIIDNLIDEINLKNKSIDVKNVILENHKLKIKDQEKKLIQINQDFLNQQKEYVFLHNKLDDEIRYNLSIKQENVSLNNKINDFIVKIDKLNNHVESLLKENSDLKNMINNLKCENERLNNKYQEIISSNSWKKTKPLRKIKKYLK